MSKTQKIIWWVVGVVVVVGLVWWGSFENRRIGQRDKDRRFIGPLTRRCGGVRGSVCKTAALMAD